MAVLGAVSHPLRAVGRQAEVRPTVLHRENRAESEPTFQPLLSWHLWDGIVLSVAGKVYISPPVVEVHLVMCYCYFQAILVTGQNCVASVNSRRSKLGAVSNKDTADSIRNYFGFNVISLSLMSLKCILILYSVFPLKYLTCQNEHH